LKKKKDFLFKIGIWAESTAWPSRPHRLRGPAGRRHGLTNSWARTT
jgi:hypothetical protein